MKTEPRLITIVVSTPHSVAEHYIVHTIVGPDELNLAALYSLLENNYDMDASEDSIVAVFDGHIKPLEVK